MQLVPKLLNSDQKNLHISIAQELFNNVNEDPDLLKRVMNHGYFVMTSNFSSSPHGRAQKSQDQKKHSDEMSSIAIFVILLYNYSSFVFLNLQFIVTTSLL